MICKSRKSKGIIRDNVTEKRFFTKNSFNFRLELSTRILKAILTTTVLFSYHSYATCLPQQCYFLTTAVVRLLLSIKRDSFRRYRGELNALGNVSKAMNAFIMLNIRRGILRPTQVSCAKTCVGLRIPRLKKASRGF